MKIDCTEQELILLRRIIMQSLPNLCFEEIGIIYNSTLLDNDHIRKRVSNIPVRGEFFVKQVYHDFLDHNTELIVNHVSTSIIKRSFPTLVMKCYKKYDNQRLDIIQEVTTNDCIFSINDKQIPNPYPEDRAFKIVDLKYVSKEVEQHIEFIAQTKINIPFLSALYSIAETPVLMLESHVKEILISPRNTKMKERDIIEYAIYVFSKKFQFLCDKLKGVKELKGKIEFVNDLYTMPVFIARCLNENQDILMASNTYDNMLNNVGYVTYVIKPSSKKSIYAILKSVEKTFKLTQVFTANK
jgi:hypothetical protein